MTKPSDLSRHQAYEASALELRALLEGENDRIARMATIVSVLFRVVPGVSFVGFYRLTEPNLLVVGPYQGPPACLRITFDRGVCGAAARERRAQLVPDVHAFPGHIACDAAARSELVVPILDRAGALLGVLDLDSHEPAAFDELDQAWLEGMMRELFAEV
ncbi:MAG: GAF domain-containing protein [Candidatus Eisenbacteria bacterium]